MVNKILTGLLFLCFASSFSYGKPHTKHGATSKTQAAKSVKSKASPRKKTRGVTKSSKKVQPRKKIVRARKKPISKKRIRIPLTQGLDHQTIIKYHQQEADLKRQEATRIPQQKVFEEKLRQQERARIQREVLEAQQRQQKLKKN